MGLHLLSSIHRVEGFASLLARVFDITTRVCSVCALDLHGRFREVVKRVALPSTLHLRTLHVPCFALSDLS